MYSSDVNFRDEEDATPVHYAARYKRIRFRTTPTTDSSKIERQVRLRC